MTATSDPGDETAGYEKAVTVLLRDLPVEQQPHGRVFLLDAVEELYMSAGKPVPSWLREMRIRRS